MDASSVAGHYAGLRDLASHLPERASLVPCLGDARTHPADMSEVEALLRQAAGALAPAGRFVATFRDCTVTPSGGARSMAVRADANRILSCFIETVGEQVIVHARLARATPGYWVDLSRRLPEAARRAGIRARHPRPGRTRGDHRPRTSGHGAHRGARASPAAA
jgi:hypothetical protein